MTAPEATPAGEAAPEPGGPASGAPLLLLDGMSLAFRAWFALPADLATADGTVTNAVHGFLGMLVYLVRDLRPNALAVAFDLPGATFRDELLEDYKAGRSETPSDLLPQFDMIRSILGTLGVPVLGVPGYEADDVLATLATEARDRRCPVVVVTGDRDAFQLVEDPYVRVLYNRRGVSDYALYDEAGILERTGVRPDKYHLLAALRGDPSDNLPGVPGVGEKTAAKLLTTYGDIDGIYEHLPELTPKLRENLALSEDQVRSNLAVIPLVRDVAVGVDVADLSLGGWDLDTARVAFSDLELNSVWRRVVPLLRDGSLGPPAAGSAPLDTTAEEAVLRAIEVAGDPTGGDEGDRQLSLVEVTVAVAVPADAADAAAALAGLRQGDPGRVLTVAGRWEGSPGRGRLAGLVAVTAPDGPGVWIDGDLLADPALAATVAEVLSGPVAGHEVKELLRSLLALGIDARGLVMDTAVAAYLLDPSLGDYTLAVVAGTTGGTPAGAGGQAQLSLDMGGEGGAPAPGPSDLAVADAGLAAQLVAPFDRRLAAEGLKELHDEVETPLVRVLARMEDRGVRVDVAELRRITTELVGDVARLEAEIHQLAGREFTVNSTPQLRTVLFDELGLTPGRKTKTGYSTDAATLETLRDAHPIVERLLTYREVEKLRSTYGETLLAEVGDDARIHASFRQTVARTGRLSSERPNLHNIPVRTEAGRRFRRAFVPDDGWLLLVADYDQIELRVIAHLSGDPGLTEAFATGADIHRAVAAGVYGVTPAEVTYEQRERAKMVSYGLAYGMEAFGLARRLSTGVEEATEIINRYFAAFPEVRAYMDMTVAEARARGYTRTALGRKRPLPELSDRNYRVRQAAERQAMNAGIQGLAADLFKTALVRLDRGLELDGLRSRLVLQVHDEVIVEVHPDEEDEVRRLTRSALTEAATLSVPLEVSMGVGTSWDEAKGG